MSNPFLKAVGVAEPTNQPSVVGNPFLQAIKNQKPVQQIVSQPIETPKPSFLNKIGTEIGNVLNALGGITQYKQITEPPKESAFKGIGTSVFNALPNTMKTLEEIQTDPFNLKNLPSTEKQTFLEGYKTYINKFKEVIGAVGSQINEALEKGQQPGGTFSQKISALGETGAGLVNLAISPISAWFESVSQVPVIGTANKLLWLPLTAAGDITPPATKEIIQSIPNSILSQKQKDDVTPGIVAITTLVSQFALLGLGTKSFKIFKDAKKAELIPKYGEQDAQTIVDKAEELAQKKIEVQKQAPIKNPFLDAIKPPEAKIATKEEWIKGQAIKKQLENNGIKVNPDDTVTLYHATSPENITKINSEGVIKGGGTATGGMTGLDLKPSAFLGTDKKWVQETWGQGRKVIEIKVPVKDIRQPAQNFKEVYFEGGLKRGADGIWRPTLPPRSTFYDRLAERDLVDTSQLSSLYDEAVKPQMLNQAVGGVKEIVPETKPSGIAKSIEAKAIEKGLIDKGYNELAGYDASTIKAQSELASKYDIEQIKKIATGKEPLPEGMKPATALSIAEDYAMETKDGQLASDLAKSPLATQISESASITSLSRMRTPDSATAKIKEVMREREKVAEKKLQGKTANKAQAEIKNSLKDKIAKTKPNKISWENFLDTLKC